MRKSRIAIAVMALMAGAAQAATPTVWTNTISTAGSVTTIKFNDWGYTGPSGVGANDFQVGSGFDSSNIGQIQHVVTSGPDWKTPDDAYHIEADLYGAYPPDYTVPDLPNASMDSGVNFYAWGYTTGAGSTFNNMQIDKAGNYHIARDDMAFKYYDSFAFHDTTGANPDHTYDSNINFQPYTLSDAKGWCGSVLKSNPNGLAEMAGQVTFDIAFDVFLDNEEATGVYGEGVNIQVIPGFVMRSYGSYEMHFDDGSRTLDFAGSAVVNNTNPLTGLVDPDYKNKVSFLGGGVIPLGAWINLDNSSSGYSVAATQGADGTTDGQGREDGAVWHFNSFAGFPFLMRADGSRTLDFISPTGHSAYVTTTVPVPAAAWLLGSGLIGLAGAAVRRRV